MQLLLLLLWDPCLPIRNSLEIVETLLYAGVEPLLLRDESLLLRLMGIATLLLGDNITLD